MRNEQHTPRASASLSEKTVFRSIAFPVSAFDYLKDFQRAYERRHGVRLNNNEALSVILNQHRQFNEESAEHGREAD